jgi:type IX secretion system PorP/SprF family membrane protein
MTKKIISSVLASLLFLNFSQAQQLQMVSQFGMQNILINPAAAGANGYTTIGANYRKMWGDFPGAPKTAMIYGEGYIAKKSIGIGGSIYNDITGPTQRNGFNAAIAYHVPIAEGTKLSVGMEARVLNFRYDRGALAYFIPGDPILASSNNRNLFDAGAGFLLTGKNYSIGASAQQLLQTKTNYLKSTTTTTSGKLYRHYYGMANYTLNVDGDTKIIPNCLLKYMPEAPTEFDLGVRLEHKHIFWWGVNHRFHQSFSLYAGVFTKNNLTIGYGFDVYKTPLSLFDKGGNAHEIMLQYAFKKK